MARVLVDTSAIYALLAGDDANHRAAKAGLERLRKRRDEPFLTNLVRAECHALLLTRLGPEIAGRWLLTSAWPIERTTAEDEDSAKEIIASHNDKSYSFTDAASFAVMKRLRVRTAFAFDRHFAQFGIELA